MPSEAAPAGAIVCSAESVSASVASVCELRDPEGQQQPPRHWCVEEGGERVKPEGGGREGYKVLTCECEVNEKVNNRKEWGMWTAGGWRGSVSEASLWRHSTSSLPIGDTKSSICKQIEYHVLSKHFSRSRYVCTISTTEKLAEYVFFLD
jgi:hypothetical protein